MSVVNPGPTVVSYLANGATTVFPIPFKFFANTDIVVYTSTPGNPLPIIAVAIGWTVVGLNVVFAVAPVAGLTVFVTDQIPQTQPAQYVTQDNFPAATQEGALDRLTMLVQQLTDKVLRSFRIPITDAQINEIPLATRSGKILSFDVSGNPTLLTLPGSTFGLICSSLIIGETGGGPTKLDGLDASLIQIGSYVKFTLGGIGAGAAVEYQLTTSALALGPGIVAALNVPTARWIQVA